MPDEVLLLIERFKSKKLPIPIIVSKDRFAAIQLCLQDEIFYNLADSIKSFDDLSVDLDMDMDMEIGGSDLQETYSQEQPKIDFADHCMYKDIHDEFEEYKKIGIIDDGFTALSVKKNIDIVLIDETKNIFDQNVIPGGILREPISSLKYANAMVITKTNRLSAKNLTLESQIRTINKTAPIFYSYYNPTQLLNIDNDFNKEPLLNKKIIALSAIGNPSYFYENLKNFGIKIDEFIEFEDHHAYSEKDLNLLEKSLKTADRDAIIITTLKDFVKLKNIGLYENTDVKLNVLNKIFYLDFELIVESDFFDFIYSNYENYLNLKSQKLNG